MKQLTKFVAILSIGLIGFSCEKDAPEVAKLDDQTNSGPVLPNTTTSTVVGGFETKGKTLLLAGAFVASGSYSVSGKAFVYEDTDKSKVLVIEDLKSSAGPDLRFYLASDKAASNSIEIFNKVENGSRNFKIPASADLTKLNTVLIWCKAFSVTFGSAQLK